MTMTMMLSSAADSTASGAVLSQDERSAAAAKLRRFGYLLLTTGVVVGVIGIALWAVTGQIFFLALLLTTVFDSVLAARQFAAARRV